MLRQMNSLERKGAEELDRLHEIRMLLARRMGFVMMLRFAQRFCFVSAAATVIDLNVDLLLRLYLSTIHCFLAGPGHCSASASLCERRWEEEAGPNMELPLFAMADWRAVYLR